MDENKQKDVDKVETPFFNEKCVKFRYTKQRETNQQLLTMIRHRGFRTIQDFANTLGVSRSLISQIIHGFIEPTAQLKLAIARKLGTDTIIIFGELKDDDE